MKNVEAIRTIGVLTSGGDAPGMNAAIRAVVRTAIAKGYNVMGIRRGYHGLLREEIIELNGKDVADTIYFLGNCESDFITGQVIGTNGGFYI